MNAYHPAQRFAAPSAIQTGTPLKQLLNGRLVGLIGQSLAAVVPEFDLARFRARATRGLAKLELKDRAAHIARAMAEQLPDDFSQAAPLLIRSFGPPLAATEGNGLAPFFYFPHTQLIAEFGVADFRSGMLANYELTQRFTAEFSLRPFLIAHRDAALQLLKQWTRDANPHVRRLVSEGTRPRLPWAMRLPEFQRDPQFTLPLLEALRDDPELYVRRSVANHLADIAKDHLEFALEVAADWLRELDPADPHLEPRRWLVRHALRHPAKKQLPRAVQLRALAAPYGKSPGRPRTSRKTNR